MLDIGTSCEDTLQVHPVSLDVNSHVKCSVYLVQSLLPSQGLIFINLLKIGVVNIDYTTHTVYQEIFVSLNFREFREFCSVAKLLPSHTFYIAHMDHSQKYFLRIFISQKT